MIYFTSDLHFGHKNIIQHCNRPYSSVEEMNEALISNWNERVRDKDTIYILGDIALSKPLQYLTRLNGQKYLIYGNHDRPHLKKLKESRLLFWVKPFHEIKWDGEKIVLCHYALRVWNRHHYGSWHLYGHSHGTLPPSGRSFDVGVDCWDYKPISVEQVRKKMKELEIHIIDHHTLKEGKGNNAH